MAAAARAYVRQSKASFLSRIFSHSKRRPPLRVTRNGGRRFEWEKIRERNEALDCRTYARAAAAIVGLDRLNKAQWEHLKRPIETEKQIPQDERHTDDQAKRRSHFWKSDSSFW